MQQLGIVASAFSGYGLVMNADLKARRGELRISQSRLAKLAGVSRFKICLYELGEGGLAAEEQARVEQALREEAERIHATARRYLGAIETVARHGRETDDPRELAAVLRVLSEPSAVLKDLAAKQRAEPATGDQAGTKKAPSPLDGQQVASDKPSAQPALEEIAMPPIGHEPFNLTDEELAREGRR
jgi:hypothetical protein